MQEQQILDLTRRVELIEKKQDGQLEISHRMEVVLAEVRGGVGVMKWALASIIPIGGLTIAAVALWK